MEPRRRLSLSLLAALLVATALCAVGFVVPQFVARRGLPLDARGARMPGSTTPRAARSR